MAEAPRYIRIGRTDNVAVALTDLAAGERCEADGLAVTLAQPVGRGHKFALTAIPAQSAVIKYDMPIGNATREIRPGEFVHTHNLKTRLSGELEYSYAPAAPAKLDPCEAGRTFQGFRRADGTVGIRNDLWIVPTVGCVNKLAENLARDFGRQLPRGTVRRALAFPHPYGCSQLGGDHEMTAKILAALVKHPNAGGVLVVALGCENNTLDSFKARLAADALNIRFLRAQDPGDEFARGCALIDELLANRPSERVEVPVSDLVVGLKCGGSDGFSGLTANPLVGRFSDGLVARGGSTVLTEVPEMFGAETLLMARCRTRAVFERCVAMVNGFKDYYARHGQVCYENPSPGNKAGGITTLEDKSLGCVQKGGSAAVEDVLAYGGRVRTHGLTLLSAPGNDLVAATALAAAGCHLVLFTTGRGTPFGTAVPTLKVATNTALAAAKPHWIDWDAMANPDAESFAAKVFAVASGEPVCNEVHGDRGIAIFKDGVTL